MSTTPADLPDSIEELRALVLLQQTEVEKHAGESQVLRETLDEYKAENERLAEAIRLLKHQRFGRSSERSDPAQRGLFNEAEVLSDAPPGDEDDIEVPAHQRRRGGRRPLPDHLPRVEVVRDLDEHEKVCPNDPDHVLKCLGEERAERVIYRPAELFVEVEVRPKYACGTCKDGIACSKPSPQPIPKSLASPSLLAQIAAAKYVDGLPLARQEKIFARIGLDLPRATLATWMIRCGDLVAPLTELLLEEVRQGSYVLADETPFQVLKETGKRAESQSYLWALRLEDPAHPLLYYEYAPTRGGEVAQRLLVGFEGYLQTDGYKGYDGFDEKGSKVVHVGCFAHARRKFDEALRGQGQSGKKTKRSTKKRLADQGFARINALFKVERRYAEASPEERHRLRQKELAPLLKELRAWTTEAKGRVPPTSLTGSAIVYLDNQWPKLVRVLEDGRLELSTNSVERAIRPFVIRCSYCTPSSSVRKQRILRFSRRPTRADARGHGVPDALAA
jgi:transposase